jgi:hypothetical protein
MKFNYAREKFANAVYWLTTAPHSLPDRLLGALVEFIPIEPDLDLPENMRLEFVNLRRQVTRELAKENEGTIVATLEIMSVDEAVEIARKIYDLETRINNDLVVQSE